MSTTTDALDAGAPAAAVSHSDGGRRPNRARMRLIAGTVLVLALGSTLLNDPGAYIADARFEHYWASDQYFSRHQWLWDSFRGLGKVTPYFAPFLAALLSLFAQVGIEAATAERLLQTLYLVTAALGMVAVLRLFRPNLGIEHLLAALVYTFSAYTSQFLLPSGLFLHYALSPWLVYAFGRGVRHRGGWRWPAAFALAVFVVGSLNVPSLIYAVVPLVPFAVYVVHVERVARWRDIAGFVARAGLLIALGSVATAMQLQGNSRLVTENLATTELPSTVSKSSSWGESWRGLGFWLTYFRSPLATARPEASDFFQSGPIVIATFVVPLTALCGLAWSRWRPRLLFAAMVLTGLVFMVGLYPVTHPTPVGELIDTAYQHILFLRGLRSGYKAGPSYAMGIAALFGVTVAQLGRRLRYLTLESIALWPRFARASLPIATAGVLFLSSSPFWTGNLYSASDQMRAIPTYWQDAFRYINALPNDARVLILPGAERNRYRWGYVGDDIFDANLTHPHLLRQSFSQGAPEVASILTALDDSTANDVYRPGSFAPTARLLGIRWVVIRNDLAWEKMGAARPSQLNGLRADPNLHLVATFGQRGQNTTAASDTDGRLRGENQLPPVEVYEIDGVEGMVHLLPPGPPTLISGDGNAVVTLGLRQPIDRGPGVVFTGSTDAETLTRDLEEGAGVVVSDTNRRRSTQVTSSHNYYSYTLPDGQELERPPLHLFTTPGSESVTTYGDASSITASGFGSTLTRFDNWYRPANAFDGDPTSSWRAGGSGDPVGQWIQADLRNQTSVSQVTLVPAASGSRRVAAVELTFSDGSRTNAVLGTGPETHVQFSPRVTRSVRVTITQVSGSGIPAVGFSEIEIGNAGDLRERVAVPDDLFRAADSSPRLSNALANAPITYQFKRVRGLGGDEEEHDVRRQFRTIGARDFDIAGTLAIGTATDDAVIDSVLGGPVGAVGSTRNGSPALTGGYLAIDGRLDTAWIAPVDNEPTLSVRLPSTEVDRVRVVAEPAGTAGSTGYSGITSLEVRIGDITTVCTPVSDAGGLPACEVDVPPSLADHVELTVKGYEPVAGPFGVRPVGIVDVSVEDGGVPLPMVAATDPIDSACRAVGEIDGRQVFARLVGTQGDLLDGRPIALVGCALISMDEGLHSFSSLPIVRSAIDELDLSAGDAASPSAPSGSASVASSDPTDFNIVIDAPTGGVLTTGQSYAPGWQTDFGGRSVAASERNGMSAWLVPPNTHGSFAVAYAPQRTYEFGLALLGGTAALCLLLVLRRREHVDVVVPADGAVVVDRHPLRGRTLLCLGIVVVAVGAVLANLEGALLAAAAMVAIAISGTRLIGWAAAVGLGLTAVTTLGVSLPAGPAGISTFVANRDAAAACGLLTGVLVLTYVLAAAAEERAARPAMVDKSRVSTGSWRERVVMVIISALVATIVAGLVGTHAALLPIAVLSMIAVVTVAALGWNEEHPAADNVSRLLAAITRDHIVHGSLWIMAGFVTQALTGVLFWILAARFDSAADVGRATALFASLQFINYATALGLQELVAHVMPTERRDADCLLTWSILATTTSSALGTIVLYGLIAGGKVESLSSITRSIGPMGFFAVSAGSAIALLVDARLTVARRWRWIFGRLVLAGILRVPLLLIPVPFADDAWLFLAISGPIALSGVVGLVILAREEAVRFSLRGEIASRVDAVRYALVNHITNLALMAPQFGLPVIVFATVAPEENANFFIAWSIAAVAFILPTTIGRVLLSEASRDNARVEEQARRALKLAFLLMALIALGAAMVRALLAGRYGADYTTAADVLPVLAIGGLPWSVATIVLGRMRVHHDHVGLVTVSATLGVGILGTALVLVPAHGVAGAVAAWVIGASFSAVIALALSARPSRPLNEVLVADIRSDEGGER